MNINYMNMHKIKNIVEGMIYSNLITPKIFRLWHNAKSYHLNGFDCLKSSSKRETKYHKKSR